MKKQKQQVISRFFAPKSKSLSSPPPPQPNPPPTPPPKISATVTFSPSKRLLATQLTSPKNPPSKIPKLSLPSSPNSTEPTQNPNPDPTLHQRFLNKLLEPSDHLLEPSPSRTTTQDSKFTPLEQQVVELKENYPDVLLMVEVGYRYRFFGQDAENAARVLGIYAHMDHNFLTASVPTFRLNVHVRRLVSAGYKVGVVKQTETAAIKAHGSNKMGPFGRGLSALYTKATLEAAEDVGIGEEGCGASSNYLICVVEKEIDGGNVNSGSESGFDVKIGFVAVEISTGEVVYGEFDDNFIRAGLEGMILSLSPAELLLGEPLSRPTEKLLLAYAGPASNARVERASRGCFNDGGALAEVMSSFWSPSDIHLINDDQEQEVEGKEQGNSRLTVEGIMAMTDLPVQALALIIRHLKQFGFERILCSGASFRPFSCSMEVTLSANAIQQLEVLKNNSDGSESGSLLQCMNNTLTVFGSRLLRHWVTHPLCDRTMIDARLDAVSEIAEAMGSSRASQSFGSDAGDFGITIIQPEVYHLLSSVLTYLGRSPDIQRGITRIFHRTATAAEFVAVIQAILVAGKKLQQLHIQEEDKETNAGRNTARSMLLRKLISIASSSSMIRSAAKLLSTLNKDAADKRDLPNLFNTTDGQFPEVTKAKTTLQSAMEELALLIGMYRKQLGKCNLEFTSVSGITHLIELPLDVKVPSNWVKVNSTKKTIRYHPPEVLTALDQLSVANEELNLACRAAWDSFLKAFGKYYPEFQAAVQALAALDCLHSLAILSRNKNYVRPVFVNNNEPVQIQISSGRHPVMETILQDNFVPNDTNLHADEEYCQIITGPNMGGKSCYIRQVALIAIMAQVGSFVPASSAKLYVLDGIHTRMGASDSIQHGRSTFLEELSETSHIVHTSSARSLVIIDELGRGTSTHDGVAIAYATLQYLLKQKRCLVLFVTHYPKVMDIKNELSGSVGAYHVSYLTSKKDIQNRGSNSEQKAESMNHEDVTYLYKLVPGVSERSFGFKVAQLAQLPSSCINRAIIMATKLEAAVSNREKNRSRQKSLKGTVPENRGEMVQEDVLRTLDCTSAEGVEGLEKLINTVREVFSKQNIALLGDDDLAERIQILKHARRTAGAE
ncbi:hypothetical protein RJ640_023017 [Escallonia rubra]|uniref:DNA mismatch repair protein n=1 Tax=Escallonia rubra TaxID=112253 RepID=A0AA88QNL1_9ASTE|nr:hypothetical protein RJ640_023017 [Escallonia rubra]